MGVLAADQLTGIAPAMSHLREQAWRLVNLVSAAGRAPKEDGRKVPDVCSGRRRRCRPSASLRVALGQARQMSALGAAPLVPGGTSRDVRHGVAGRLHEAFPCQQICQRNARIPANTSRHRMAWMAPKNRFKPGLDGTNKHRMRGKSQPCNHEVVGFDSDLGLHASAGQGVPCGSASAGSAWGASPVGGGSHPGRCFSLLVSHEVAVDVWQSGCSSA